MKYLKKYKLFESLVDKKIQLLKDLSLELQDAGLQVEVINGSHSYLLRDPRVSIHTGSRYTDDYKKFIIMKVTDDNERFNTDLYFTDTIQDFIETLKSYGMNPRGMSGGNHFAVFKFDKHGSMTNSPIIRESNSNKEVLNNIEDIFCEIEDLGFKVEYNRGGVGEVTRIYIEKFDVYGFSDEPRPLPYIPGQEFVLALQHLISYVSQDYDIEIESICNSQCIDHLSSKSEDGLIENDATIIGNYKVPIDYIKVIISSKEDN